jgi:16S rRNA C1402 N4-methylase RsmH
MFSHTSVLIREVESVFLTLDQPRLIIDATLGLGGHTMMMLSNIGDSCKIIGFDRDADNLSDAQVLIESKSLGQRFI